MIGLYHLFVIKFKDWKEFILYLALRQAIYNNFNSEQLKIVCSWILKFKAKRFEKYFLTYKLLKKIVLEAEITA